MCAAAAAQGQGISSAVPSQEEGGDEEELDADFLQQFAKIKQRDPAIYDSSHRLFDVDSSANSSGNENGEGSSDSASEHLAGKGREPKYLREVMAEQVR